MTDDAAPLGRAASPPTPQGDLDDRAETVEPPTGEAPLERSTAALFRHHAFVRLWFSRLAGTLLVAGTWLRLFPALAHRDKLTSAR